MGRAKEKSTTKDPVFAAKHQNAIAAQHALGYELHAVTSTWTWERNLVRAIGDIPYELLGRMDAAGDEELRARARPNRGEADDKSRREGKGRSSQGQRRGNPG
jgi:hypothetical protein